MSGCTSFSSAIGHCAIAWRGDTIIGLSLPMEDGSSPVERLLHRHPGLPRSAAPPAIQRVIARLVAHLYGALDDLRDVPVQSAQGTFDRTIYALTREIPPGATRSYGELATAAGDASLAREVGQAMGRNPTPLLVPCHRVLPADGSIGGFSAPGGSDTKRRLLAIERAQAVAQLAIFD
jgi:methylated-DNA-[protein]-cysteine S-methyltransferase